MSHSPLFTEDLREITESFLTETHEAFDSLEADLRQLKATPGDTLLLERIFRTVHTTKGTALFLGLEQLGELTHRIEDVLTCLRDGRRNLKPEAIDVILRASDVMKVLVRQVAEENIAPLPIDDLVAELQALSAATHLLARPTMNGRLRGGDLLPTHVANEHPTSRASRSIPGSWEADLVGIEVAPLDYPVDHAEALAAEFVARSSIAGHGSSASHSGSHQEHAGVPARTDNLTRKLPAALAHERRVQVGRIFDRFHRVVRELSAASGKQIALVTEGGESELDRSAIEGVSGALVQLIRNAADHGIEPPKARIAAGKSATGHIRLGASCTDNYVIIIVEDDGAGLDPDVLRRAAIDKKLITRAEAASMSDARVYALIFHPGFSTAPHVSKTSGRGIGMDVVKANVARLDGTIRIESSPGHGTRFILRLPR